MFKSNGRTLFYENDLYYLTRDRIHSDKFMGTNVDAHLSLTNSISGETKSARV